MVGLLGLLLEAFLPLTASDLEEWRDFPEQYYLLQDSLEPRESVRVSESNTDATMCCVSNALSGTYAV